MIAMLAITKAGAAYVPLDPASPRDRLRFILDDTRAGILLTEQPLLALLPETTAQVVCIDDWEFPRDLEDDINPPCVVNSDDLCYIMYTSGSTGVPKGVAVPHRGIVRLLFDVDYAQLEGGRTILQMAPAAFDASTFEIWVRCSTAAVAFSLRADSPLWAILAICCDVTRSTPFG